MTTVLYVEDHAPARFLMTAIIEDMTEYQLLVAECGRDAEAILQTTQPDIYILDLDLPDTDGLTLAGVLTTRHLAPVILVSAYAESIQTGQLGVYLYLSKPLDPDDVVETLRRALS
jgi:CheY-like chemotaxis protein